MASKYYIEGRAQGVIEWASQIEVKLAAKDNSLTKRQGEIDELTIYFTAEEARALRDQLTRALGDEAPE